MKKKILLLVTGLSSLALLVACSNQSNHLSQTNSASSVEQSQSDGSESENSSSSEEKKVDTSAYEDIISKYQTAVADNQTDASINPLVVTYARSQTNPASTVYAYYDMDGNGLTSWSMILNLEMSLKTISLRISTLFLRMMVR